MKITMDMIEDLKKRKDVSYAKAKEALEYSNGDLLEAIIYLEDHSKKEATVQPAKKQTTGNKNFNIDQLLTYLKYNLAFKKDNIDQFSLPIWLLLIIFAFAHQLVIIAFIIAIVTQHKIYIKK